MTRRRFLASAGAVLAAGALPPFPGGDRATAGATPVKLRFAPMDLRLAHRWTIARGSADSKRNGLLTLEAEGITGLGEAAANVRWGQSFDTASAAFQRVERAVAGF